MSTVANQVVRTTIDGADQSGRMFAKSEIDATEALEVYARTLGTEPTFEHWSNCRVDWVNAYVSVKPQAKGNSADKAFARFKARLNESFGIEAPKATSEAAEKKALERAKRAHELEVRFSGYSDADLNGMLKKAYEDQARNPMKKSSILGELERVVKQRMKDRESLHRDALKAIRTRLFTLAKACIDPLRIEAACDVLDPEYEISVE